METDMWNEVKIIYDREKQQASAIDVYRKNMPQLQIDLVWHSNRASHIPKNKVLFDKKAWKEVCNRVPKRLDFVGILFGLEGLDVEGLNAHLGLDGKNKNK